MSQQQQQQVVVHPDLLKERSKTSFDVPTLNRFINNNDPTVIDLKKKIRTEFLADPILSDHPEYVNFLSREDQFKRAVEISERVIKIKRKLGIIDSTGIEFYRELYQEIPLILHDVVFVGCMRSLASEEQLAEWLPKALNYQIIGAYAQTELGHGSNVQALETTAHYLAESDEFVLNSPTLTSSKWWIGALGRICTHAVVFAQLHLKDKDGKLVNHGPHPFLVQVRSHEQHQPMSGITVGDIGPKLGYSTVDNGFMRLDHVKIPRKNLFARYAQVTKEGRYVPPPHPRLVYAGMVGVRVYLVGDSFSAICRAVTVAARYSVIRRQFGPSGKEETQVLDYQNQQARIVPSIAAAYAFLFVGRRLSDMFSNVMYAAKSRKDTTDLPELHALSSGLKTTITYITSKCIEDARFSCGGHGYNQASGLVRLYNNYLHLVTAEGENNILPQQTARFLLKEYKSVMVDGKTKLGETTQYLVDEQNAPNTLTALLAATGKQWSDPAILVRVFAHRSAFLIARLARLIQEGLGSGRTMQDVWNSLNVDCIRVSEAHSQLYILNSFATQLSLVPLDARPVLVRLCQLYALNNIERNSGEFLIDQFISQDQIEEISKFILNLYAQLRPDIIGLVDTFDVADHTLGSSLGRYDGQVYPALWEWANKHPLNTSDVGLSQFFKNINNNNNNSVPTSKLKSNHHFA
ncbi:acyl-CoA oxidase [Heterostelium album PN500]|uniref:Acyl-coenzyme A oxidase n=1 Tax=Heterostelium pallidum (strain ATCC 26659 / Pp 5 / PN500) TaxID=670386 RepID=D3BV78_HETP5|nr:acyl-CoA oxidase [Heterostelium album PN500]EFA74635.1 acyl-CoA oxidase [Heterostelium album PN500]|eukprot:XP_020426769.1 acyl-CoA oxidase [Heterostelium album PN500]